MPSQEAPYGTWKSSITVDALIQNSVDFRSTVVDEVTGRFYYVEQRENGRHVIVDAEIHQDVFDNKWSARTRVHEYGGVPTVISNDTIYFSSGKDGRVYRLYRGDRQPEAVTPENKSWRYAELTVLERRKPVLFAVLEDHSRPEPSNVRNALVAIDPSERMVTKLVEGADFYSSLAISPDGSKLVWVQWYHPDMPWEGSELVLADIVCANGEISIQNSRILCGKKGSISVVQPQWASNDFLIFLNDSSGYSNPWIHNISTSTTKPLFSHSVAEDFSEPAWFLGRYDYAILDSHAVLFSSIRNGRSILSLANLKTSSQKYLPTPYCVIRHLRRLSPKEVVFICKSETVSVALVKAKLEDESDPTFTTIRSTSHSSLSKDLISVAQSLSFTTESSEEVIHALYLPPFNPTYTAPLGELPPAIISVHGGPTDRADAGLSWLKQFWTTRGWAWIDVNYGGSSGYGKNYRDRLRGNWGIVDVRDTITAVTRLREHGLIDPNRTFIRGDSAGGFTVLACLVNDVDHLFRAATSCYGVSDLVKLPEFSHKFESRYYEGLIGGSVKNNRDIYFERSPINHVEKINAPLLVLQGSRDPIVVPDQAEAIVNTIRQKHGHVKYILFDGESHGWRKPETIKEALETELAWYQSVLGLSGQMSLL